MSQSPIIRRFADAWQRGDDNAINQITIEVTQSGNDADIVALSRVMGSTPYGGK